MVQNLLLPVTFQLFFLASFQFCALFHIHRKNSSSANVRNVMWHEKICMEVCPNCLSSEPRLNVDATVIAPPPGFLLTSDTLKSTCHLPVGVSPPKIHFFHQHVSLLLIFHFLTLLQWEMLLGNRLAPSFQEAKCRPWLSGCKKKKKKTVLDEGSI